jgi:O-antigen ligase
VTAIVPKSLQARADEGVRTFLMPARISPAPARWAGAVASAAAVAVTARAAVDPRILALLAGISVTAAIIWRPIIGLFAWVTVVPLLSSMRFDAPGLPALTAARAIALMTVLATAAAIAMRGRAPQAVFAIPALAYVAAAGIAYKWRPLPGPTDAASFVDTILVPFSLAVPFLCLALSRRDLLRIVRLYSFTSVVIAGLAIREHATRQNIFQAPLAIADHVYRARGPFEHPIVLGGFLACGSLMLLEEILRTRRPGRRALFTLGLGLNLMGAFFTYSRGPLLAALIGAAFLLVRGKRLRRVRGDLAVLAIATGFAIHSALSATSVVARLTDAGTINTRLSLYHIAWHVFLRHPLFGVGVRGFGHVIAGQLPAVLSGVTGWSAIDNSYLQVLVESGAFGAVAFLALLLLAGRAASRAVATDPVQRTGVALLIAVSVMAFSFDAFDFAVLAGSFFLGLRLASSTPSEGRWR